MPADAVCLHRSPGTRPIGFSTLNGVRCILTITLRRRISKCACMRVIRTTALTLSSGRYSRVAINCMCRVYKVLTTPLHRTSAMRRRRVQVPAPIPAPGVAHRRLHRRLLERPAASSTEASMATTRRRPIDFSAAASRKRVRRAIRVRSLAIHFNGITMPTTTLTRRAHRNA